VGDYARLDTGREQRKGVPEVVYAAAKTAEQVVAICQRVVDRSGRAILSRAPAPTAIAVRSAFGTSHVIDERAGGSLLIVRQPGVVAAPTGGRVAIVAAGTSDLPYAEEAGAVAAEMGCVVRHITDVGVAGLHRLFGPLQAVFDDGVDVLVVAAGMDGALPSVVAGLAPVPVIGLPTPVGYGLGGEGIGALTTMLQSCAPGLAVVNIGNGVGAGAMAALIANQVAAARQAAGSR
jgi:NCAIR mutase (PurE)-related protein